MFPTVDEYWSVHYDGFQKNVMLRMSNVPYLLDNETLIKNLICQKNLEPMKPLHRQKDKFPQCEYYGKASIPLDVKNQQDENALREWSLEPTTGRKQ